MRVVEDNALIALLAVLWTFECGVLDVLESADSPAGPWCDVAGPYPTIVDNNVTSGFAYRIENPPGKFFRVRRIWGAPQTLDQHCF